jgi:hypothetical protein
MRAKKVRSSQSDSKEVVFPQICPFEVNSPAHIVRPITPPNDCERRLHIHLKRQPRFRLVE